MRAGLSTEVQCSTLVEVIVLYFWARLFTLTRPRGIQALWTQANCLTFNVINVLGNLQYGCVELESYPEN